MMKFNHDFSSRFRILKGGKISLVVSALLGSTVISFAAPSGGTVTTGTATISQSGNVTNINQSTQKASINWQNFNIASNETVNFNQPNVNSITLNRVIGNEKSVIDGALNANGQVWILNSNGILFNSTAKINTAGIVATTAQLSDADFQAGNYNFKNANSNSVVNLGTIEVSDGGYVVLASNEVRNSGTIKAVKGKVHLTGASEYTVNLNGNSIVNLVVTKGVLDAMVENSGTIIANGGEIYLTTNAVNELLKGVVNNTGILEANSLDDITGKVEVFAHGGTANVSGSIEAVGGFVETSGKELSVADGTVIKAKKWLIDPENVVIESSGGALGTASVSASVIETALETADVEIQATNDITVNEAINIHAVNDGGYTVGGLGLTAGNDININNVITVGPEAYLVLNYGWNGDILNPTYGNGGKITFGTNLNKDDFVGKVAFAPNVNTPSSQNSTIYINDVEQTIIRDATQLQAMNDVKSGNYVLAGDINLLNVTWTPIGNGANAFTGTFNGLGHTLSNLEIEADFYSSNTSSAAGFFGNITGNANISSVKLADGSITNTAVYDEEEDISVAPTGGLVGRSLGDSLNSPTIHNNIVNHSSILAVGEGSNVGGIVGQASYTTISDNSVVGNSTVVSFTKRRVGGIVGSAKSSTISNSYVDTAQILSNYGEVGGIAGFIEEGTIIDNAIVTNSLIIAMSDTEGTYGAGGIVGTEYVDSYDRSEIKNSAVDNSVIVAMQDLGGIIGEMNNAKITNSFYELDTTRITNDVTIAEGNILDIPTGVITYGGIYASEYQAWAEGNMATLSAASLLQGGNGYYNIFDVSDFRKMLALAYDPANKFRLASSFTLDEGLYLPVLRGELDGNNFTLSGLNVSQSYNSHLGLVGRLEGGTIKNLTLTTPTLSGYSYVGGIVGLATQNDEGTQSPIISNVTVNGFAFSYTKEYGFPAVETDTNYDVDVDNIGAIGGRIENGTLSNLTASGAITINVTANNFGHDDGDIYVEDIAGLIGEMRDSTLDTASSSVTLDIDALAKAHTDIQKNGNDINVERIGGLIGYGTDNSLIKDVGVTGAIDIKATIEKTVTSDDIEGYASIYNVGGLFGQMSSSYIKTASATNTMTLETNGETGYVGGLVGEASSLLYDTATTSGAMTIKSGADYVENIGGAFGYTYESILKDIDSTRNVTIEGSPSDGVENVGGLVGDASETNIISSSYSGTIDVKDITNGSNIGGLVGNNYGYITDKDFVRFSQTIAASVSAQDRVTQETALLAKYNLRADVIALKALGYTVDNGSWGNEGQDYYVRFSIETPDNTEWGVIKDSTASVNIKAQHATNVGGLVGNMDTEDGGQIINSSVTALNGTGKVEGDSNVGGLVGYNSYGNITGSNAAINVEAKSTMEANVGGLVGYNEGGSRELDGVESYIQDSYSNSIEELTFGLTEISAARAKLAEIKDDYIADVLAANPGFEVGNDYLDVYFADAVGNLPDRLVIGGRLELVKEQPLGAITNSSATGTVTSAGIHTGGLVGYLTESTVTGSHATGVVAGGINHVGGLVGYSKSSTIDNSYATGAVSGTGLAANYHGKIGGLVGTNDDATISNSYATGDVTSPGRFVGGLAGRNEGNGADAKIINSYATGNVVGAALVGGLVGISYGDSADSIISNSYATGDVSSVGNLVGGLVGANENYGAGSAIIENSYATGAVSGAKWVGGLVGENAFWANEGDTGVSKISQSYATGTVNGTAANVGGLVGEGVDGIIEESYATGKVTGTSEVGGLIGKDARSTISNVYASGEVVASGNSVGSLIGQANATTLTNSYASGKITLTGTNQRYVKGLFGDSANLIVTNSFYDKTVNTGMADENSYGKSTTELKTLATYTTALENAAWNMGGANGYYPILDFAEDRTNMWMMAEGDLGGGSTPVEPTPVDPTPEPVKQIEKVITSIVNNQQINIVLPTNIIVPFISFVTPQPIVLNNNLALKLGIAEGSNVSLSSTPQSGQVSQRVSLNEISSGETRIALGGGSIIELVNSGVSLPTGVDQEFYVVKNDATDTSNNRNNKNNKNEGAN